MSNDERGNRAVFPPRVYKLLVGMAVLGAVVLAIIGLVLLVEEFLEDFSGSPAGYADYRLFVGEGPRQDQPTDVPSSAAPAWSDYPFRPTRTRLVKVGEQWRGELGPLIAVQWYRVDLEARKAYSVDLVIDEDESAVSEGHMPRLSAVWDIRGDRVSGVTEVPDATRPALRRTGDVTLERVTKKVQRLIVVPDMDGFHFIPVAKSRRLVGRE